MVAALTRIVHLPHTTSQHIPLKHRAGGDMLAIGFGTTTAMWLVAYVCLMQPGLILGETLFALTLACLLAGGFTAGRFANRTWRGGAIIGAIAATINLLVLGSVLMDPDTHRPRPDAAWWVLGNYAVSIALAAIGAAIGRRWHTKPQPAPAIEGGGNWHGRFAIVVCITIFLLLITGGLVTGLQAGMAVPDWPRSFGHNMFLFPLAQMKGGVFFEHAHRLYGTLVGLSSITLAIVLWIIEGGRRTWLAALGSILLLMVIGQGILGGTRVTENSLVLATIHGVFAQIVFATAIAIAAFLSTTWLSDQPRIARPSAGTERITTALLVALLVIQLILGAYYRHVQAYEHATDAMLTAGLHGHITGAVLVTGLAIFCGIRAWGFSQGVPIIARLGKILLLVLGAQVMLGIAALIAVLSTWNDEGDAIWEVVITTAHQATGALLLAVATLLMLWTRRLLAPA
jgi:cytochrome c oxidase assembly protein subunit 15